MDRSWRDLMRRITILALSLFLIVPCIAYAETMAEPENISISGDGQEASQEFFLDKGLSIFSMKHSGSSNFAVWLLDSNGEIVDLLVNEIGSFDGSKATGIEDRGIYCLDISADGNWRINISQ